MAWAGSSTATTTRRCTASANDGYWRGFNTTYYNYLTDNHTVVLLSNRGDAIDFNKFWEKLSELIGAHVKD